MYSSMSQRLVNRLFCTVVEGDDSVEDVKDVAFASMIVGAESCTTLKATGLLSCL